MNEKKPITNSVFTVKDENGKNIECEILFTFESPETKKNYIVYTDNTKDDAGSLKVYANVYDKSGATKELYPLETEEEWNTVETILAKLEEKDEKENSWKK